MWAKLHTVKKRNGKISVIINLWKMSLECVRKSKYGIWLKTWTQFYVGNLSMCASERVYRRKQAENVCSEHNLDVFPNSICFKSILSWQRNRMELKPELKRLLSKPSNLLLNFQKRDIAKTVWDLKLKIPDTNTTKKPERIGDFLFWFTIWPAHRDYCCAAFIWYWTYTIWYEYVLFLLKKSEQATHFT